MLQQRTSTFSQSVWDFGQDCICVRQDWVALLFSKMWDMCPTLLLLWPCLPKSDLECIWDTDKKMLLHVFLLFVWMNEAYITGWTWTLCLTAFECLTKKQPLSCTLVFVNFQLLEWLDFSCIILSLHFLILGQWHPFGHCLAVLSWCTEPSSVCCYIKTLISSNLGSQCHVCSRP